MRTKIDGMLIRAEEIVAVPTIVRTIARLERSADPKAVLLGRSLREWRDNNLTEEEQRVLSGIVSRWNTLRRSTQSAVIDDFGADSIGKKQTVRISHIAVLNSRSPQWLPLMFRLVRRLQPQRVLELGTCLGISGMYIAAGLRMNGGGTLVTVEGEAAYADIARKNFSAEGLTNVEQRTGRFADLLPDVVKDHRPIDLVFVDGHHDGEATIRYFEQILPALAPEAWMIFDDISWSRDMKNAWKKISADPRVHFSADAALIGICHIVQP